MRMNLPYNKYYAYRVWWIQGIPSLRTTGIRGRYLQILKSYHSWLSWRFRRLQGLDWLLATVVQVHPENDKILNKMAILRDSANIKTKSQKDPKSAEALKTKSWTFQSIIWVEDMIRDFVFEMSWCCSMKTDDIKDLIHGPIQCLYKYQISLTHNSI